jgi:hypothetical protein
MTGDAANNTAMGVHHISVLKEMGQLTSCFENLHRASDVWLDLIAVERHERRR